MLDKKTASQCISSDYRRGWNDAVDAIPPLDQRGEETAGFVLQSAHNRAVQECS